MDDDLVARYAAEAKAAMNAEANRRIAEATDPPRRRTVEKPLVGGMDGFDLFRARTPRTSWKCACGT